MTIRKDHSGKKAMKHLYMRKYNLDKNWDFKVPRLKVDIEAYLHILLDSIEEAFEIGNVVKYSGHELNWFTYKDSTEGN